MEERKRLEVNFLADRKDDLAYEALLILEEKSQPQGSGVLSQLLNARGLNVSEATVGRMLSEMDRSGLTEKVGFQGRVITEPGRRKLDTVRRLQHRMTYGNKLLATLESRKKEDLIDILVARRAIERELARLAAIHATEDEISLMDSIIREQEEFSARNIMTAEHDVKFHRLIAVAAGNKVLAAAVDLIRQDGQLSPILEYIRTQVGGKLAVGHERILQAIRERNPAGAEQAMIEHIESLIADVQKYWAPVRGMPS